MTEEDYEYRQGRSERQYRSSAIAVVVSVIGLLLCCLVQAIIS